MFGIESTTSQYLAVRAEIKRSISDKFCSFPFYLPLLWDVELIVGKLWIILYVCLNNIQISFHFIPFICLFLYILLHLVSVSVNSLITASWSPKALPIHVSPLFALPSHHPGSLSVIINCNGWAHKYMSSMMRNNFRKGLYFPFHEIASIWPAYRNWKIELKLNWVNWVNQDSIYKWEFTINIWVEAHSQLKVISVLSVILAKCDFDSWTFCKSQVMTSEWVTSTRSPLIIGIFLKFNLKLFKRFLMKLPRIQIDLEKMIFCGSKMNTVMTYIEICWFFSTFATSKNHIHCTYFQSRRSEKCDYCCRVLPRNHLSTSTSISSIDFLVLKISSLN